jgi:hypothetical protein
VATEPPNSRKFLIKLDNDIPAELDVHLICDNYATHKTPTIANSLGAHPRFHMHFTPTYSSSLNRVERWFAVLTDKRLRRGTQHQRGRLEERPARLDQNLEPGPQTICLDQNRRRDPRRPQRISTADSWRRTLAERGYRVVAPWPPDALVQHVSGLGISQRTQRVRTLEFDDEPQCGIEASPLH